MAKKTKELEPIEEKKAKVEKTSIAKSAKSKKTTSAKSAKVKKTVATSKVTPSKKAETKKENTSKKSETKKASKVKDDNEVVDGFFKLFKYSISVSKIKSPIYYYITNVLKQHFIFNYLDVKHPNFNFILSQFSVDISFSKCYT